MKTNKKKIVGIFVAIVVIFVIGGGLIELSKKDELSVVRAVNYDVVMNVIPKKILQIQPQNRTLPEVFLDSGKISSRILGTRVDYSYSLYFAETQIKIDFIDGPKYLKGNSLIFAKLENTSENSWRCIANEFTKKYDIKLCNETHEKPYPIDFSNKGKKWGQTTISEITAEAI